MILVTGATGQLGGLVVEELLRKEPASNLAVSVRDVGKAAHLKARGIDVRQGDFDQPATLDRAFAKVDRLLVISTDGDNATRIRQHRAAIEAATRAKVGFLAYTSIAKADSSSLFLGDVHRASEAAIHASGLPFCLLRNNWYAENEQMTTIKAVVAGASKVPLSAGNGKVGWAARRDYAAAAAAVLATNGHDGRTYELAGPPLSYASFARLIAEKINRPITIEPVSDDAYRAIMTRFQLPDFVVDILVDIQRAIREGQLDVASSDLERLLGRPVTPLADVIADMISVARKN